jgi:diguanylate cyclase (GGDEF)-like protein
VHGDVPDTAAGDASWDAPIAGDGPDTRQRAPLAADTSVTTGDAASASADQDAQRNDATNIVESQNDNSRALLAWLIGGVLLLGVCLAAAIKARVVRPFRRLLSATTRIANGESGVAVPRGGTREIDALASAVNDIAAQLATAREGARDQQHLLEAKVAERTLQLQELAQLDPLTLLANRRYFFELLNAAIENAARENRFVGVFFLDIDNFKNMNDSLGHEFGDQVLQNIARRLSESAYSFGFAARLGGDEFIVAYESASSIEDIRIAGLQLIWAFQEPIVLDDRELIVSISAGASVYPNHAQNAEALLRAADAALYEAKAIGRSRLALFEPALLEAATARISTEQGLRRAIDRGEFELAFQPEVNLQTCEIEVVEALLRWRLPDGRYALPGEFLAVAESSGLILPINDWVIRRAIETVAEWRQGAWPSARIAINVSSRQLFDNSFVEQVQALLEEYTLPPDSIEIELTETVLQTGSATIAALQRLHGLGIGIALDDFGTGFSSLTSLEQLPLSRIKLDRSLIASIDTSARSAAIARAIIQLCQGLGLLVTAEGIERPAQLTPLVGYPGLHAQGYLLARPQSPDQLFQVMATLPTLALALVRASVARLPDSQLAENLPFVTAASED